MENPSSSKVAINNPADIVIIAGYFVMVIGVGIWVSVPLSYFTLNLISTFQRIINILYVKDEEKWLIL